MRLAAFVGSTILVVTFVLTACGGSHQPAQPPPAEPSQATALPPEATAPPPTAIPSPTLTPEPTATPVSLSDVASEFRTFVNTAHNYAIQVPPDWQVTPRGAAHADAVTVAAPGETKIRGANQVPPLVFSISALGPNAGYASIDAVQQARSFGDEVLETADVEVNGLPVRRIHSRDEVYGNALYYIIQRDNEFFVVQAYGYELPKIEPILNTFGPAPDLTTETVTGQIQQLGADPRRLILATETGAEQQIVWFTDTEILPLGRLEGHIDAGDHITAAGILADNGELQATTITLETPQHAGAEAVLEFRRSGGVARFDDSLVIFGDGTVRLQQGSAEPVEKDLSEEQWQQVKNYVSIFEPFAWHHEDNPGGPDNLVTDLDFYGAGSFEPVSDNQEEIVNYVQEILVAPSSD